MVITFYGAATDAEYIAHLHEMTQCVAESAKKHRRTAVITDASRWVQSNAVQRKMHAEWMLKHDREMRFRTAGVAFVITSALVRGGLNAVLWFAPLPCPHKVVTTLIEAEAWANSVLSIESDNSPEAVDG